jgi:hypothetical protein
MRAPIEKPTIKFPTKPLPNLGEQLMKAVDNAQHAKLDTNHDGQLNRDEFDAGNSPIVNALGGDQKFDRYDKDNDGYVSKDEYHTGKTADRASTMHLPHFPIIKQPDVIKSHDRQLPDGIITGTTPGGHEIF